MSDRSLTRRAWLADISSRSPIATVKAETIELYFLCTALTRLSTNALSRRRERSASSSVAERITQPTIVAASALVASVVKVSITPKKTSHAIVEIMRPDPVVRLATSSISESP